MIVLEKYGMTSARFDSDQQIRINESDYDRAVTILSALDLLMLND
jgi:hypothetical protein